MSYYIVKHFIHIQLKVFFFGKSFNPLMDKDQDYHQNKKEVNTVHCGVVLPNLNVTEVFEKLILVGQYGEGS